MTTATAKRPTRARKPAAETVEKPDPIRAKDLADALADALLFAGNDYTLPVLNGIRLEADGVQLTAVGTNRYVLGVRKVELPSDAFTFLLNRDDTKDLISLLKTRQHTHKRGPEVSVAVAEPNGPGNGRLMTVKTDALTVQYNEVPGEFPKWRGLVENMKANEKKDTVGTCGLNAHYLALFSRLSTVGPMTPLRLTTTGANDGVQLSAGDFWGALMPVRLSEASATDLAA